MREKGRVHIDLQNTSDLSRELAPTATTDRFRQLVLSRCSPCCGADIQIDESETKIVPRCTQCGEEGPTFCKDKSEKKK